MNMIVQALPKLIRSRVGGVAEYYTHAGRVLARTTSSGDSFYHADVAGNVRFQTTTNATLNSQLNYLPFGQLSQSSLDSLATGQVAFQFAGEPFDPSSQLTYLRQRHYMPAMSRFISRDPFYGFETAPLTQNPYQYALNSPLVFSDPSGELPTLSATLQVAAQMSLMLTIAAGLQALVGTLGRGETIDYSGPLLSYGFGATVGVGGGIDYYSGIFGSSDAYDRKDKKEGHRLSTGTGITFGFSAGLGFTGGLNAGGLTVKLTLNMVTRPIGGMALSGFFSITDVAVQAGLGESPFAFTIMGFAKGRGDGGGSVGFVVGAAAGHKTGVFAAIGTRANKGDANAVRNLGENIGKNYSQLEKRISNAYTKYFAKKK